MNNDDFKKILDEAIKPLWDSQENFRKELSGVKGELGGVKKDINGVKKATKGIKKELEEVKKGQAELKKIVEERVLPSVTYTETTVKSYADRYVTNEDHIRRLDKRLNVVEDDLGIQPPEELTIPQI